MRAHAHRPALGCLLALGLNFLPAVCPPTRAAGPEIAAPALDEAGVLALAQRWFTDSSGQIEPQHAGDLARLVGVPPRFDARYLDDRKGRELANAAAAAIPSPGGRVLGVALASAAVGQAPKLAVTAHNLAAALYVRQRLAGFAIETDRSAARDAVALYRYALTLDPTRVQARVNLGNVLVDLQQLEEGRSCFEAALKQDAGCLEAHVGMATYWLARGDKEKARAEMQSGEVRFPASTRKIAEKTERLEDPAVAPQVTPDDGIESIEDKLRKLRELTPMSTADIIEEWDPADAQQIRIRVNNLPKTDLLQMPSLTSFTMFGSNEQFGKHQKSVRAYKGEIESFFKKWGNSLKAQSKQMMTNLGGTVTTDARGRTKVGGALDKAKMKAEAARMRQMAKDGKLAELMQEVASKYDPAMLGLPGVAGAIGGQIEPTPAPSLEGYLAAYNFQVYNKKYAAWIQYWPKYLRKQTEFLSELGERRSKKVQEYRDQEAKELEDLKRQYEPDSPPEKEGLRIALKYLRARNQERESWYHDGLDTMLVEYSTRMRPNLEAMWADLLPHLRLIRAKTSRDQRFFGLSNFAIGMASQAVGLVISAAEAPGAWEDPAPLENALMEAERLEAKEKEEADQADWAQMHAELASANAPDASLLDALIDGTSYEKELGPVKLKITPDSIEVSGGEILQGSFNYNWKEDTLKTYLGVGASFSTGDGPVGASATLGTGISFTVNTNTGRVSEIDWTGTAGASGNLGVISAGASYEASVMHGNTLSYDVTANLGQPVSLAHDQISWGQ